ncbi:DUF6461 domain-containing protein [Streptomyces wuyuanensis]|nr:DUF6461 domain-containing protein [Streptomyces wuyuanensis]
MRDVGLAASDDEYETSERVDTKAAVFGLAERLTGVRATEELLQRAEYQLGHVPEEPAEEWTGIIIEITDAHGERFYREFSRDQVETGMARARAEAEEPIVIRGPSSPAPDPQCDGQSRDRGSGDQSLVRDERCHGRRVRPVRDA